jgi:hypothetical protein
MDYPHEIDDTVLYPDLYQALADADETATQARVRRFADSLPDADAGAVFLLFGIARKNENESVTENSRHLIREIAQTKDDVQEAVRLIAAQAETYDEQYRLYGLVNRRDALQAAINTRDSMNNHLTMPDEHQLEWLERTGSRFRSELQSINSRDDTRWLIDIDSTDTDVYLDTIVELKRGAEREPFFVTQTPNGWHAVVDGDNPHTVDLPECVEVKQDSAAFLGYADEYFTE